MFYLKRALLLNLRSKAFCHAVNRAVVFDCLFEKSLQTNKTGRNMSIISIVDKIQSLSIEFDTNQSTNIGNR